jgi:hypothetical protein
MKTYYAFKNKNNQHKQDPDYFIFLPKKSESDEGNLVGKIYKNRNKNGEQYLTIIFFREGKGAHHKEDVWNKEN